MYWCSVFDICSSQTWLHLHVCILFVFWIQIYYYIFIFMKNVVWTLLWIIWTIIQTLQHYNYNTCCTLLWRSSTIKYGYWPHGNHQKWAYTPQRLYGWKPLLLAWVLLGCSLFSLSENVLLWYLIDVFCNFIQNPHSHYQKQCIINTFHSSSCHVHTLNTIC